MPVEYRNVEIVGGRVRGERTTAEPTDVFLHGRWETFDRPLIDWWVEHAVDDDVTWKRLCVLLEVPDGVPVVPAVREASPATRLGVLWALVALTGTAGPAAALGVPVDVVEAAVEDVRTATVAAR